MSEKELKKEINTSKRLLNKLLNLLHIRISEKTEKLVIQIFKFGIVGVVATIIDFVFLYVFKDFCHFNTLISNTLSFCISVIYNYWASIKWVFDINKEKNPQKNFIVFILFSIIGLILNDLIMWIATDNLNIYYMISKIIATSIVMIFNFITRKKFLE